MVTEQDVREVMIMLNKLNTSHEICISDDCIEAIERMCKEYEEKYKNKQ